MRVLFFVPNRFDGAKFLRFERCQGPSENLRPPISMGYIAALLKREGFDDLKIIDARIRKSSLSDMLNDIDEYDPDLVFIQSTTPTIYEDIKLSEECVRRKPSIHVAFLGSHVSVRPEDVLSYNVPFAIRNEPEYTACELVKALMTKGDLSEIDGLSYYRGGRIINNKNREFIEDLDSLPFPDRNLIENAEYVIPVTGRPFTLIKTSRGCPSNCIFCTTHSVYGKKWRTRSTENIITEIVNVKKLYGISDFFFSADTFNLDKKWTFDLCNKIIERKLQISWMANSRVDTITEELASVMKRAGCWLLAFGIESGSQKMLNAMKKGIRIEQAISAIKIVRKAGIRNTAYFVIGLPGETTETINETYDFVKKYSPDYPQFLAATPYPGTEFFNIVERENYLKTKDWSKYSQGVTSIINYPELRDYEIRRAVQDAHRKFYLTPIRIIKELCSIREFSSLRYLFNAGIKYLRIKMFGWVE